MYKIKAMVKQGWHKNLGLKTENKTQNDFLKYTLNREKLGFLEIYHYFFYIKFSILFIILIKFKHLEDIT